MIPDDILTETFGPIEDYMADADKNPKHAAGRKKASMDGIPPIAIVREGAVMRHGYEKYGKFNWGEAGVVASVYYEAALRHLLAWYTGEDIDPESGQPHLAHVRACAGIVIDCTERGILDDDRPTGKTTLCAGERMTWPDALLAGAAPQTYDPVILAQKGIEQ